MCGRCRGLASKEGRADVLRGIGKYLAPGGEAWCLVDAQWARVIWPEVRDVRRYVSEGEISVFVYAL